MKHFDDISAIKECCQSYPCANPKVSVIIPAYNTEQYIAKCLKSLISQTLKEIEIIVINDGSTDSTLEIINEFAAADGRIKVISQENKKQGAARNRGMEIAAGEYIGFVDSDDWVDPDFYEKLYNAVKKDNFDIAVTSIIKHKEKKLQYNIHCKKEVAASDLKQKIKLCEDKKHRFFSIYNKIYKASLIKDNDIFFSDGIVCEDIIFSIKTLYFSGKIITVPGVCYHYTYNVNSAINGKDIDNSKKNAHVKAYSELVEFAKKYNIKLYERLNYTESSWKFCTKVYRGVYKSKCSFFGLIPLWVKYNDK